jgi:hypothetical protein
MKQLVVAACLVPVLALSLGAVAQATAPAAAPSLSRVVIALGTRMCDEFSNYQRANVTVDEMWRIAEKENQTLLSFDNAHLRLPGVGTLELLNRNMVAEGSLWGWYTAQLGGRTLTRKAVDSYRVQIESGYATEVTDAHSRVCQPF